MINNIHDFFTGKNILVTGGNGYLGSTLIDILKEIKCKISILTRVDNKNTKLESTAEIRVFISDIRNPNIWNEILEGVDLVFYFAGQTSVYKANENPKDDFEINVQPLVNLLETCKIHNWKPGILLAGTVTETGIPVSLPVNEMRADKPVTFYDLHKLIAENYLRYYANNNFVKGAILRLANVYGPGIMSLSVDRGIINMMVIKALNGDNLTLYGDGTFLRDYLYIDDAISAFLFSAMNLDMVNGNYFIVGTGVGHTILETFEIIKEKVENITNRSVNIISVKFPENLSPIESRNFVADNSKIKRLTGWNPEISLDNGIVKTIKYFNVESHPKSRGD